jgi:TM2 domain-containing membrane protein YozV
MITRTQKWALLAALFVSFSAGANEIYIEQVGDNSTITITQDGASNTIGTQLAPAFIGGGSNTLTIDQIGSGNEMTMTVNGASTTVAALITGSNNVSAITCGTAMSASCSGSDIQQTITGDGNTVTQNLGGGANHTSILTVTGDTNTVTHTSTNTGAVNVNYTVAGDTNNVSITTSGTTAKTVNATTTGNGNTVTIVQTN